MQNEDQAQARTTYPETSFQAAALVTDLSVEELFLEIQPDEKSRQEAIVWLARSEANAEPPPILKA